MTRRLVVNFHGIGAPPAWADADERRSWCTEAVFNTLLDCIPSVTADTGLPIELTFDDGNLSDVAVACPALARRGLKASFFVCAGRIGQLGYLGKHELHELAAAGMQIGSHGWGHIDWRRVRDADVWRREVVDARDCIEQTLGMGPIRSVAIPFGSYDRRVVRAASQAFSKVYTSDGGPTLRSGVLVPRESYTVRWDADTLQRLASPMPLLLAMRRSLVLAYKRRRASPQA